MFRTPILFIVFNRPETTQKVFQEIRKQRPEYLFIAADGPRPENEEDNLKCEMVRTLLMESIDWDCEVKTLFRKENLGCGKGVSLAIDWFFNHVEQGIILEDDCLPHPSFFNFCETLLDKYRNETQIFAISGNNFQNGIKRGEDSYYFSSYGFIWGWATWKRAWKMYDFELTQLGDFKKEGSIKRIDRRKKFRNYWFDIFQKVKDKEIDTWDYQWLFALWYNQGIAVQPNVNLVSNIGFDKEATHTKIKSSLSGISTKNIGLIKHPHKIEINKDADNYSTEIVFKIAGAKCFPIELIKNFLRIKGFSFI